MAGPAHRQAGQWDSPARRVGLRSPPAPGPRTARGLLPTPPSGVRPEPTFQKQRRPEMRSWLAHQAPDGGERPQVLGRRCSHPRRTAPRSPRWGRQGHALERQGLCRTDRAPAKGTKPGRCCGNQAAATGRRRLPGATRGAGRAGGLGASLGVSIGPSRPEGSQLPQTCQPSSKGGQQSGPSQERSWGRRGGTRIKPSLTAQPGLEAARAGLCSLAWSH